MRDSMSSNTTGRGRAPSNNPAVPGIPKGVCVKFQTGQCTYGSDCRFEHVKAPKGKGKGKKGGSRSQTPRKYRSQSPPGSKPQVCKCFKANRCERGKDCPWQRLATSKAAPAPKADKTKTPSRHRREKRKRRIAGLLLRSREIRRVPSPSNLRDRQRAAMRRCASFRRWCAPRPSTRSPPA